MRTRKFFALLTALIMCVLCFAGCGNAGGADTAQNAGGTDGLAVVATVNGRDITVDEYRFFVNKVAPSEIYSINKEFSGDFSTVDWNAQAASGKSIEEAIKERALREVIDYALLAEHGAENGIKVSSEDIAQIDSSIEQFISQNGEGLFNKNLSAMGLSSPEGYRKLSELMIAYSNVENDFAQNKSKYIEDEKQMQSYSDAEHVSTQHILIKNDSQKHENPETVIKEVLERAKAGEDFNALMTEFNEDPGQQAAGYSFGRGEMLPEFEDAAFALDYNEISDVISSDYGCHIIKRVVGLYEYKNFLRENANIKENEDVLNDVFVRDTVMESFNALKELNEMSGGNANG